MGLSYKPLGLLHCTTQPWCRGLETGHFQLPMCNDPTGVFDPSLTQTLALNKDSKVVLWQPKLCFFVGNFEIRNWFLLKLVGLSRSVSMGETRGATGEQPRNISIICSGLNSTDTNKGRTKSLRIPRAGFIDCGGVIQQTWGSILRIVILLMAKIWTSFGWWFIYIYLTIYRVLYIPGAAFEPLIKIFVLPVHLQIQYSIVLCLFILVEMTSFGQGNHGVITAHDTLRWSNPSMISSNKCWLNQSCPSYTHTCKPKYLYISIIVLVPIPKSYSR